ncbi:hypothetical protein [Neobacillus sp. NPDC093127]|uniref:hypothetical protein n=1 Tax=Neobacillus sp. NPDC093127 TaxID=3364296 RepID=UPI003826ADC1
MAKFIGIGEPEQGYWLGMVWDGTETTIVFNTFHEKVSIRTWLWGQSLGNLEL